ncbi:MAG: hypothetical protein ACQEXJ_07230 [Myxococcota bacterium]
MTRLLPPLGASLALLLAACGAGGASLSDAVESWRAGDRAGSLGLARAEYARFRDANDLDEVAVREAAGRAETLLSEQPIRPRGDGAPPAAPGADAPRRALHDRLRRDLLSEGATPVTRGILVVRDFELRGQAPLLLAVVYERRALEADGGVLDDASPALRTVAIKRLALDALERL